MSGGDLIIPVTPVSPASIRRAAEILRGGGVVGMPTETVYGLAANALNERAVARVFEVKGRPSFDPLIVHVPDIAAVEAIVSEFPPMARQLAERFWPGPLTLVLPKRTAASPRTGAHGSGAVIPDIVTSGLPTVAVRVPSHPAALALLHESGVPIAAPSANRFGSISPTRAEHVAADLGRSVDMILDGGPCAAGVESTVISLLEAEPVLLRPGGVALEDIEALVGKVRTHTGPVDRPAAPGMLERHYAPRTRLVLVEMGGASAALRGEVLLPLPPGERAGGRSGPTEKSQGNRVANVVRQTGLLRFMGERREPGFAIVEVLSRTGDLREAAANLFAAMRRLDAVGLDLIIAESAPPHGLGLAINDRLRRASK